jgi:dTDP-4-amino-4,6-dideoxygalactose transaminase
LDLLSLGAGHGPGRRGGDLAVHLLRHRRSDPQRRDAAQAIGARQQAGGERITTGTLGDACAFSFFPTNNLGAFGDAGMVTTNDAATAERLRRLRVHSGRQMYHHEEEEEEVGYNSRLDALRASSREVVSLPVFPELTQDHRERGVDAVRSFFLI